MTQQAMLALHALRSRTLRRIECVALIACSASKCPAPAPARHLYTGQLFRASVRYAEAASLPWAVLSAKHGLLLPDDVIEPYCQSMRDLNLSQREAWARLAANRVSMRYGKPLHVVLLAGAAYCEPLVPELWRRGWITVEKPLAGLRIGQQRQRLAGMTAALACLPNLHHLGLTASGQPRHPLYLPASTMPRAMAQEVMR